MQWQPIDTTDPSNLDHHYSGDPAELVDAVASLLLAMQRPAWMRNAACRGLAPATFFPPRGVPITEARRVCAGCPVRAECQSYALEQGSWLAGVWSGTNDRQRRQLRSEAHAA